MDCKVMIGRSWLRLISFDGGEWKSSLYIFDGDIVKRDLFLKLLEVSFELEAGEFVEFDNFAIGEETQEILDFFAGINLTEEEKLKKVVKQYLHGDMDREKFEEEITPYRVAEKLSR